MLRALATLARVVLLLAVAQLLLQGVLWAGVWLRSALTGESTRAAIAAVTAEPLALGGAQLFGLGLVIVVARFTLRPEKAWPEALELGPAPVRGAPAAGRGRLALALAFSFVAGLALQLPLVELMNVLGDLAPALARAPDRDEAIRAVVRIDGPVRALTVPFSVIVVPAVSEEILFRGIVLGRLREILPPPLAVALVALLFGIFHLEPLAIVYATLAGLVLGALAHRTRSIRGPIALHAGFNALPVLVPETLVAVDGFNTDAGGHVAGPLLGGSAALAAVALALATWLFTPESPRGNLGGSSG